MTGCTVGPDFKRPAKPATTGYTPENLVPKTASADVPDGGAAQTFDPAADIPGQWWELFRSAELNGLIVQALKANPELRDIPIIMVTVAPDRGIGLSLGAAEVMTKPVDRAELTSLLRHLLTLHAPEDLGLERYRERAPETAPALPATG